MSEKNIYLNSNNKISYDKTNNTSGGRNVNLELTEGPCDTNDNAIWNGLVHYWSCDTIYGDTAYDSIGGKNGDIVGYINQEGKNNHSIKIIDENDVITMDDDTADFNYSDSFSFSFWVKRINATTDYCGLINKRKRNSSSQTYGYLIYFYNNKIYVLLQNNTVYMQVYTTSTFTSTSSWYHVVFAYGGGGASTTNIYVNGSNQSFTTGRDDGSNWSDEGEFGIGSYHLSDDYVNPAQAYMDEVGAWNRKLSSTEVTELYNSGSGKFYENKSYLTCGLVSYWSFDETSGTTASDSVGSVDGTVHSGSWTTGKHNNCLNLQSGPGYVDFGVNYNWESTQARTIAGWFKTDPADTTVRILTSNDSSTDDRVMDVFMNPNDDGALGYLMEDGGSSNRLYCRADSTAMSGYTGWYHVAFTYDGSKQASGVKIYLNGSSVSYTVYSDTLTGSISGNSNHLYMNYKDGTTYDGSYVDELGLWDRELTPNDVSELYNSGAGRFNLT